MEVLKFKNVLWDQMREIAENMDGAFKPVSEEFGLTMTQLRLLLEIRRGDGQTVGGLGKCTGIANTNVSSMCRKLEKEGYICRIRDQMDERIVHIALTEKGQDTLYRIDETMQARYASVLAATDPQDLHDIHEGLKKLILLLQQMNTLS